MQWIVFHLLPVPRSGNRFHKSIFHWWGSPEDVSYSSLLTCFLPEYDTADWLSLPASSDTPESAAALVGSWLPLFVIASARVFFPCHGIQWALTSSLTLLGGSYHCLNNECMVLHLPEWSRFGSFIFNFKVTPSSSEVSVPKQLDGIIVSLVRFAFLQLPLHLLVSVLLRCWVSGFLVYGQSYQLSKLSASISFL